MFPDDSWSEVIGGKRYSIGSSILIAHNRYWDGHNFERGGRNTFLYRTPKGNYFRVDLTQWQGELNEMTPIDLKEAQRMWDVLREKEVEYEVAFPGLKVEEA